MIYIKDGCVIGVSFGDAEDDPRIALIYNDKPEAESGYDYRLRADTLTWEQYELPEVEDGPRGYTEDELSAMTGAELEALCAELGIVPTKNKANMIILILNKQRSM